MDEKLLDTPLQFRSSKLGHTKTHLFFQAFPMKNHPVGPRNGEPFGAPNTVSGKKGLNGS
jgi:hypothetical protein